MPHFCTKPNFILSVIYPMTSDPHKNISKFPILVRPWRIFGAIPQNCWESNPASSWGTKNPPFFCGGKSSTVEDIVDLFRSERFAFSTALDIGTGQGSTAAALAVNFGIVLATETHWDLDMGGLLGWIQGIQGIPSPSFPRS